MMKRFTYLCEIPAYGFFVRHVKGIEFNDVEVSFLKEDLRPAFHLENVTGVEFNHVKAQYAAGVPVIVLTGVHDFLVQSSPGISDAKRQSVDHEDF
jgi:hypothetical protein